MNYNKYIDHTLLKANSKLVEIDQLVDEAIKYDFMSVCINPCFVAHCHERLLNTDVLVCTVIGFPLGANTIQTKVFETKNAIDNGADEIDMVINISRAVMHDYDYIYQEIKAIRDVCLDHTLKVIIETCYLSNDEIINVCKMAIKAGADFVKTSTGFGTNGATVEAVMLMTETANGNCLVKASGGIRSKDTFIKMINAGAKRIGTSSGVKIMEGENKNDTNSTY